MLIKKPAGPDAQKAAAGGGRFTMDRAQPLLSQGLATQSETSGETFLGLSLLLPT